MATRYVAAGGSGASPTTFASGLAGAHPTLAAAIAAMAAGDTILIANTTVDNYTATQTFTLLGTISAPAIVGCCDPTTGARSTGAVVQTTGSFAITIAGYFLWDGVDVKCGLSATATAHLQIGAPTNHLRFSNMTFYTSPFSGSRFVGVTGAGIKMQFDNVSVSIGTSNALLDFTYLIWRNSTCFVGATLPLTITSTAGAQGYMQFEGCDLSNLSGKSIRLSAAALAQQIDFINCKFAASYPIGTLLTAGEKIRLINCSTTAGKILNEYHDAYGDVTLIDSVYRSGGATDEAASYGVKMVSSANASRYYPLESQVLMFNVLAADVGVAKTATIYLQADASATLAANEAWGSVNYLGDSASLLTTLVTSGPTNPFANGTAPAADAGSSWTGGTTPTKYKIALGFTPAKAGMHFARLFLAKASTTVYVDPKVVLT